jgi:hypothetical protein
LAAGAALSTDPRYQTTGRFMGIWPLPLGQRLIQPGVEVRESYKSWAPRKGFPAFACLEIAKVKN